MCILPARQSYIRQYRKMASSPEKAFSVLAFHETKSVVMVQRQFRRKYWKSPPSQPSLVFSHEATFHCQDEWIDTTYESGAVNIPMRHFNINGTVPRSLRKCCEKSRTGQSFYRTIHLDMLREWLMPQLQDIPELIHQQDGAHRTSIMKWGLTWTNVFVIVGSGVEALWNGLRDRLISHRWISFCGVLWRTTSTCPSCRQHYTSSRHESERPVQIFLRKFSTTCGRRLNIGVMLLDTFVAITLNFINGK
jgi:hypothetical protein